MRRGSETGVPAAAVAVLVATMLAGCGSAGGAGGELKPMPVITGVRLSKRAPVALARHFLPSPGIARRVDASGAELVVTLRRVIDPLNGSGARLPAHARAVGVIVQIRSSGPRIYDSSATGDISVLTSGGVVTPVLATRGICRTPLEDFDRYITAGEDRIGCVVFAVADGATLDAVRFSPHAHRRGMLTWAP